MIRFSSNIVNRWTPTLGVNGRTCLSSKYIVCKFKVIVNSMCVCLDVGLCYEKERLVRHAASFTDLYYILCFLWARLYREELVEQDSRISRSSLCRQTGAHRDMSTHNDIETQAAC